MIQAPRSIRSRSSVARTVPDPWWGKVYGTLEVADHPKKAPTPATQITPSATPTPDPGQ